MDISKDRREALRITSTTCNDEIKQIRQAEIKNDTEINEELKNLNKSNDGIIDADAQMRLNDLFLKGKELTEKMAKNFEILKQLIAAANSSGTAFAAVVAAADPSTMYSLLSTDSKSDRLFDLTNKYSSIVQGDDGDYYELRCCICDGNATWRKNEPKLKFFTGTIGLASHLSGSWTKGEHHERFHEWKEGRGKNFESKVWIMENCARKLSAEELEDLIANRKTVKMVKGGRDGRKLKFPVQTIVEVKQGTKSKNKKRKYGKGDGHGTEKQEAQKKTRANSEAGTESEEPENMEH